MVLPVRFGVQMGAGLCHRAPHGIDGRASLSTLDGIAWPAWLVAAGFLPARLALLSRLGLLPLRHSRYPALMAGWDDTIAPWRRALRLGSGNTRGCLGARVQRRLRGAGADSTRHRAFDAGVCHRFSFRRETGLAGVLQRIHRSATARLPGLGLFPAGTGESAGVGRNHYLRWRHRRFRLRLPRLCFLFARQTLGPG